MHKIEISLRKNETFGVLLCLALAVILRGYTINARSLEYDEAQTLAFASLPVYEGLDAVAHLDVHPPLYYLQLHSWMALFGDTDASTRGNSVFWGMLGVWMVYIAVRRIFEGRGVALTAALLFAAAPLAVRYGQQARMYALMMTLVVAIWLSLHAFFHRDERRIWLPSGVVAVALCVLMGYAHGTGFLIFGSTAVFACLTLLHMPSRWPRFLLWCVFQTVGMILLIPWLRHASGLGAGHAVVPTFADINQTLGALLLGNQGGVPARIGWILAILLISSAWILLRPQRGPAGNMALSFIVTPLLFCILLSYVSKPVWLERTVSWTVPFLCVLIALLIGRLVECTNSRVLAALAIITTGCLIALCVRQQRYLPDYGYREATAYVHEQAQPGDIVLVPGRHIWAWAHYLPGKTPLDPSKTVRLNAPGEVQVVSSLKQSECLPNRTYWIMSETSRDFKDTGIFENILNKDPASQNSAKRFGRITVARIEVR